nr:PLP-dependent transferase [Dickeya aquatica]
MRLQQHQENGLRIAHWLAERPEVAVVKHPALPGCKGHAFFTRDFSGSNGLFSFVLREKLSPSQLANYLDHFSHFRMAYSWGGFESLILANQPDDLASIRPAGGVDFTGTLIRLHIGLEDSDDLIADLESGFNRLQKM